MGRGDGQETQAAARGSVLYGARTKPRGTVDRTLIRDLPGFKRNAMSLLSKEGFSAFFERYGGKVILADSDSFPSWENALGEVALKIHAAEDFREVVHEEPAMCYRRALNVFHIESHPGVLDELRAAIRREIFENNGGLLVPVDGSPGRYRIRSEIGFSEMTQEAADKATIAFVAGEIQGGVSLTGRDVPLLERQESLDLAGLVCNVGPDFTASAVEKDAADYLRERGRLGD
jgi:hypothetical protein